jgi:hypothetical protein
VVGLVETIELALTAYSTRGLQQGTAPPSSACVLPRGPLPAVVALYGYLCSDALQLASTPISMPGVGPFPLAIRHRALATDLGCEVVRNLQVRCVALFAGISVSTSVTLFKFVAGADYRVCVAVCASWQTHAQVPTLALAVDPKECLRRCSELYKLVKGARTSLQERLV